MIKKMFKNDMFHDGFLLILSLMVGLILGFYVSTIMEISSHEIEMKRTTELLNESQKSNESCIDLLYQLNNFNNELIQIIKYKEEYNGYNQHKEP